MDVNIGLGFGGLNHPSQRCRSPQTRNMPRIITAHYVSQVVTHGSWRLSLYSGVIWWKLYRSCTCGWPVACEWVWQGSMYCNGYQTGISSLHSFWFGYESQIQASIEGTDRRTLHKYWTEWVKTAPGAMTRYFVLSYQLLFVHNRTWTGNEGWFAYSYGHTTTKKAISFCHQLFTVASA